MKAGLGYTVAGAEEKSSFFWGADCGENRVDLQFKPVQVELGHIEDELSLNLSSRVALIGRSGLMMDP